MMLAGAEADCGESTTSRPRRSHCLPEKLSNPVCLRRIVLHAFWELWSFETKNGGFEYRFFSYQQCLLKKIYLSNKARSTIRHAFTKGKNFPDKREARCPLGPPLNPPFSFNHHQQLKPTLKVPQSPSSLKIVLLYNCY